MNHRLTGFKSQAEYPCQISMKTIGCDHERRKNMKAEQKWIDVPKKPEEKCNWVFKLGLAIVSRWELLGKSSNNTNS
jgi:hypothetical protein